MKSAIRILGVFCLTLMVSVVSHAADPTTVEELKAHYAKVAPKITSMTADYSMEMNLAEVSPEAAGMGAMKAGGTFDMLNDAMFMDMSMTMDMGGQSMVINMDMLMDDAGIMHMLMDMNGIKQAMRMDTKVVKDMAAELGVPESSLKLDNMGMGSMLNPSTMLETYTETHSLELVGKDKINGEEVYVLNASINEETLNTIKGSPLLEGQAPIMDMKHVVYLGAKDGIMRRLEMGNFMTMTFSNLNLDAGLTKDDMSLNIPADVKVMDLTDIFKTQFGSLSDTK